MNPKLRTILSIFLTVLPSPHPGHGSRWSSQSKMMQGFRPWSRYESLELARTMDVRRYWSTKWASASCSKASRSASMPAMPHPWTTLVIGIHLILKHFKDACKVDCGLTVTLCRRSSEAQTGRRMSPFFSSAENFIHRRERGINGWQTQ